MMVPILSMQGRPLRLAFLALVLFVALLSLLFARHQEATFLYFLLLHSNERRQEPEMYAVSTVMQSAVVEESKNYASVPGTPFQLPLSEKSVIIGNQVYAFDEDTKDVTAFSFTKIPRGERADEFFERSCPVSIFRGVKQLVDFLLVQEWECAGFPSPQSVDHFYAMHYIDDWYFVFPFSLHSSSGGNLLRSTLFSARPLTAPLPVPTPAMERRCEQFSNFHLCVPTEYAVSLSPYYGTLTDPSDNLRAEMWSYGWHDKPDHCTAMTDCSDEPHTHFADLRVAYYRQQPIIIHEQQNGRYSFLNFGGSRWLSRIRMLPQTYTYAKEYIAFSLGHMLLIRIPISSPMDAIRADRMMERVVGGGEV